MPMDARSDSGCFGFSANLTILPVSSAVMMPKRDASSIGTFMTEMVRSALFSLWQRSIS